mmetsp:Transcript_73470/g.215495  ORF Transcript_73470/g.215495 Transcript_73470/m.215495 type:complete len:256 (-) Transcript_73470:1547-2314(-)
MEPTMPQPRPSRITLPTRRSHSVEPPALAATQAAGGSAGQAPPRSRARTGATGAGPGPAAPRGRAPTSRRSRGGRRNFQGRLQNRFWRARRIRSLSQPCPGSGRLQKDLEEVVECGLSRMTAEPSSTASASAMTTTSPSRREAQSSSAVMGGPVNRNRWARTSWFGPKMVRPGMSRGPAKTPWARSRPAPRAGRATRSCARRCRPRPGRCPTAGPPPAGSPARWPSSRRSPCASARTCSVQRATLWTTCRRRSLQ